MNNQLSAKFTNIDGTTEPFYEKVDQKLVELQKKTISQLVEKGVKRNLISKQDAHTMQPSGKPNRLYGLPKVHKQIQPNCKIPPCRSIVSNSALCLQGL